MHQVVFTLPGGISIFGFGLMLFLALLASMNLAAWRAKHAGLDPNIIYDLAFWLILSGLLGARLFYVVQHGEAIHSFWDIFKIWRGGIVLYGSVIGGLVGIWAFWRYQRFPFWPTLDAIAPAVAMGVAIGRVGCFLNGCCFGDVCDPAVVPWALTFPARTLPWMEQLATGQIAADAARSLPIHPTQLYAAIDGILLCVLLLVYYPIRKRDGEVVALLAVLYPLSRFFVELLRGDEKVFFAGMTISQTISVILLPAAVALWIWLRSKPSGTYEERQRLAEVVSAAN
jgi:phosphatidylglycerol:prolipoprotein diacylglycerol transferase